MFLVSFPDKIAERASVLDALLWSVSSGTTLVTEKCLNSLSLPKILSLVRYDKELSFHKPFKKLHFTEVGDSSSTGHSATHSKLYWKGLPKMLENVPKSCFENKKLSNEVLFQ